MWIQLGDQNSKYFHRVIQQRRARNSICQLSLTNGDTSSNKEVISKEFLSHFTALLGSAYPRKAFIDQSVFLEKILSYEDHEPLCKEISDSEIKQALWSIKDGKSPGPDGYNSHFFKKSWSVVGYDICAAVRYYFVNGAMLRQTNATTITLIAKVSNLASLNDYRPISCCNVLYKIISKIMSSRLRSVLNKIIHPNQSVFIPGRRIVDNVFLVHELVKGHHLNKGGCCTIKVDIQKTYDSISWDFIEEVLLAFRFPLHLLSLL